MTIVKICGITNLDDAMLSQRLGADVLGFNFYRQSPRYIRAGAVREIVGQLGRNISTCGVFVNETPECIADVVQSTGIDQVQLHGDETPRDVARLAELCDAKIIKAFRVASGFDLGAIAEFQTDAVLLDADSAGDYGGSGTQFDWEVAVAARSFVDKIYLAGGLSPENVEQAIETVRPFAVDACSRLESAKGIKDHDKLERFIVNAKRNAKLRTR